MFRNKLCIQLQASWLLTGCPGHWSGVYHRIFNVGVCSPAFPLVPTREWQTLSTLLTALLLAATMPNAAEPTSETAMYALMWLIPEDL